MNIPTQLGHRARRLLVVVAIVAFIATLIVSASLGLSKQAFAALPTGVLPQGPVVNVGDLAADSDAFEHALFYTARQIKVTGVRVAVDTAITAADTNYQTLNITDGTNTIATVSTGPVSGGQSFVIGTWVSLTVVATYAEVAAGSTLKLVPVKTGTGMAMSAVVIQIDAKVID